VKIAIALLPIMEYLISIEIKYLKIDEDCDILGKK